MSVLTIHHQTIYRYRTPMAFGPHRLMLRPRESHALRLYQHELAITPSAVVTWAHDVAGNSVATASFSEPSNTLTIDSAATLSIDVDRWPVFDIAASAQRFPFLLSEDEMTDLGGLRLQAYLDSAGRVREWAQSFVAGAGTDTLSLLKDISAGVAAQIAYETREDEGAQSPDETLARARLVPRFRGVVRRCRAQPRFRRAHRLGLSLRSRSRYARLDRRRFDACLGGGLCAWRRLDHLRSDQPQRRRFQPDPGGDGAPYLADDAGFRQLCW